MAMITDGQRHKNGFEDNGIECRPWSDLPIDILDIIARKLDIVDHVSFRAACKNWREIQGLPLVNAPWMMGHRWDVDENDENVYSLCSFSLLTAKWNHVTRNKFEREGFRDLYGAAICASKHGWLLLQKSNLSFFYNPYTNSIIKLPDLNLSFNRTTFSSVPSSPDCFCFAIQSSKDSLKIYIHVCQPSDHKWTTFELDGIRKAVEDVVYCNGTFYCVFSGGALGGFDLASREWSFLNILSIPEASFWSRAHMMESHGQLWLVCPSNCFEVFKFNWLSQLWVKTHTLGCRALFLGCTSFLVSAEGETSSFADKIYYHSDYVSSYYSMETKQSYRCESTPPRLGTQRIWIQPPEQV
ncbi:hypothetical protein I3760_03G064900 [Carya illinoinensis]|nr:hypothetical protein I3760_03G064900 [Carya illinoinensis]